MKRSILFLNFLFAIGLLTACSPRAVKIVDDVIEGEAEVVEKILADEADVPPPSPKPNAK